MKLWTCITCGAVERLNHYPDCCSSCGGAMESEEGRASFAEEQQVPFEVYLGASEGDPRSTIELWHLGAPLGPVSQDRLDDLMLQNRHEQLLALFGEAA